MAFSASAKQSMACSPPNPGTISNNSCNLAENCQFCIKCSEVESGWWKKVFALRSKVRPEWEVLGTAVGHRGPFKAFARPTTNTTINQRQIYLHVWKYILTNMGQNTYIPGTLCVKHWIPATECLWYETTLHPMYLIFRSASATWRSSELLPG